MTSALSRLWVKNPVVYVLCGVLSISGCKCKKDRTDGPTEGPVVVQDTTNRMSVVSIDPSRIPENKAMSASIRGSGFSNGAEVSVGAQQLSSVTFLNSNQLAVELPAMPAGRYDIQVTNPDGNTSLLRGGLLVEANSVSCDPATVYFDTDKSDIRSDAKATLDNRASCYAQATGTITVEGHCDERGTTDYNIALGDRRASSVKKYLTGKGVTGDRISTVSFGEEQPVDPGHDESAWQKNRRAELRVGR